jgi:hypothetical protein
MPIGTPHSFKNDHHTAANMPISVAPVGLKQIFFEVRGRSVSLVQIAATASPPTKDEIERVMAVASKDGIEIIW